MPPAQKLPAPAASESIAPARPHCTRCNRALRACLCACALPVAHRVQVLVLQHPLEHGHAKGTADLLHLCLPHSRLVVGEAWADCDLQALLHAPWPGEGEAEGGPRQPVLLYPPSPPDPALPLQEPPPWDPAWAAAPSRLRLVVLDGTWRKSRKMLYANPALQDLPRLPLASLPAPAYRVRKAQRAGQLSSFEATVQALAELEGWTRHDPHQAWPRLQQAFAALMQQLEQALPPASTATSASPSRT